MAQTEPQKPAPSPELSETTRAAIIQALENGDSAIKIAQDIRVVPHENAFPRTQRYGLKAQIRPSFYVE
ncbi:hypothetical protein N7501_003005 [Penicillium viridicatum]|nr:hypothetical protein N7501_003005 [Penicillium viridicatum]